VDASSEQMAAGRLSDIDKPTRLKQKHCLLDALLGAQVAVKLWLYVNRRTNKQKRDD
jgi:hypothetical protein